jgi:hypothetical protein
MRIIAASTPRWNRASRVSHRHRRDGYEQPRGLRAHLKYTIKNSNNEVVYRPQPAVVWDVRPIVNE